MALLDLICIRRKGSWILEAFLSVALIQCSLALAFSLVAPTQPISRAAATITTVAPIFAAPETTVSSNSLPRALEIASVLTTSVLVPVVSTLVFQGLPTDWNEFWLRKTIFHSETTNAERLTAAIEKLGPTYVKFGQALSSRSDIVPTALSDALGKLQDDMATTFDTLTASQIIRTELKLKGVDAGTIEALLKSLSQEPVAAASIGQVYKAYLPEYGPVAIKVQRPGIRALVTRDEAMLLSVAEWIESLPSMSSSQNRLVAAKLVDAVDEFMSRVTEELDYTNEAANMEKFAKLYSHRTGSSSTVKVVVPEVLTDYCTENILLMEWIQGTKLTDFQADDADDSLTENLAMLQSASASTLSQLFDTGILHADPHDGNLLKVKSDDGNIMLGYLDFGMLSTVPESVRDGLVCAVVQMVFARNVEAVAILFGELQLLNEQTLQDPTQRAALVKALDDIMANVLHFPDTEAGTTAIPDLSFDSLLGGLSLIVARFEFKLPPYFLNNARALATLEGITKKLDPTHSSMRAIYPFALKRLFGNPSGSPVVEKTVMDLLRHPATGEMAAEKLFQLLDDSARLSGNTRRQVVKDILKTRGGRRMARKIGLELARASVGRRFRRTANQLSNSRLTFFRL
jgi:aarF domain-containing kinase